MAATKTRIAQFALSHLAISAQIANIDTDKSNEADVMRLWIDDAMEEVLRDFPHPFTTEIATLELVATTPNNEWNYSYRYPSRCLMFRKIQSGIRMDSRETRVPHKISRDNMGRLIYTDEVSAIGEYSIMETSISKWPVDLRHALSFLLAVYAAPSLAKESPIDLGGKALEKYLIMKSKAEANALNEEQPDVDPDSEFITGRE